MEKFFFIPITITSFVNMLVENKKYQSEITSPQKGDTVWYYELFSEATVVSPGRYQSSIKLEYEDEPRTVDNSEIFVRRAFDKPLWDYALIFEDKLPPGSVYRLSQNGFRIFVIDSSRKPPLYGIISESRDYEDNYEFCEAVEKLLKT